MVTKLVLPVAGIGKRLRPLTLRSPKALVELRGKPLLEYVLEEASQSNFRDVFLIASPEHKIFFEKYLESKKSWFPGLKFKIRIQREPLGNGHAILQVEDLIGREPFGVRFCDDILMGKEPVLKILSRFFEKLRAPIFALERIPYKNILRYGVVGIMGGEKGSLHRIRVIVEKPEREDIKNLNLANLAVVGAYILIPRILRHLKEIAGFAPPLPDSVLLTAAFHRELLDGKKLYGWELDGRRLDCGNLNGFRLAEKYLDRYFIP